MASLAGTRANDIKQEKIAVTLSAPKKLREQPGRQRAPVPAVIALIRVEPTTYRLPLRSTKQVVSNPSFENADNRGFSTESDWFLEFYNHASEHYPGVRFPMSALMRFEP